MRLYVDMLDYNTPASRARSQMYRFTLRHGCVYLLYQKHIFPLIKLIGKSLLM
jgi:hypothetical protein